MPEKRKPGNLPRVVTFRMRAAFGTVVSQWWRIKSSLAEPGSTAVPQQLQGYWGTI